MKALIKVGYGCNENCSFCHTLDVRDVQGASDEVKAKIHRAAKLGHTMVVLSGGEPTLRPELLEWAGLVASLGLDFGLVTNGQRLCYPPLVERLVALRLRYVYLSLHGGSAAVHDAMTRSRGAFDTAYKAVEVLSGRGLDLTVNCVVTRENLGHLLPLVDALRPFPEWAVQFSMVEPKGGARHRLERLVPRVSAVAERVCEAIGYGRATSPGQRFFHGGLPLCLMPGYEQSFGDLRSHGFRTMSEIGEADLFPVDGENKVQTDKCRDCPLSGPCPGLYKTYEAAFGDGELVPPVASSPLSSSFNYRLERLLPGAPEGSCPLLADGVTPWDRGRDLFLRNGSRIALYRAETRDFSDPAIAAIKHDRGQIYFDASDKTAPDDFACDLVLLARSPLCRDCAERPACTGLFEPVFEDVFLRADQEVSDIVGALEGRVLDVGCGRLPYAEILGPRATAGMLAYVGLEPDPAIVAALRREHPWGTFLEGDVNAVDDTLGGPFDHVLILRSWNHLRDPERDLRLLLPRIRPGGTLTVADNVAFGLARSGRQVRRAEASSAAREHWHDHDAEDARRCIEALHPFVLVPLVRRNVAAGSANQWLLRYRIGSLPTLAKRANFLPTSGGDLP